MRTGTNAQTGGIAIRSSGPAELEAARQHFLDHAAKLGIAGHIECDMPDRGQELRLRLSEAARQHLTPGCDTLQLGNRLGLRPFDAVDDLEKEILLAMLAGPVTFDYPDHAELAASLRIRRRIAEAARRTSLCFHTSKIERPMDYWSYCEENGFTLKPGKPLIDALRMATQPEASGQRYAFSCYRASEYVMLLGIAQELTTSNPPLLQQLQSQWEAKAIMSGKFHEVFLREYGSMEAPLPPHYYVPGDRLWFRNPDERSSDVSGYEGSWVIYLGGGLFSNFWKHEQPYSIEQKCLEIYHWRNGVITDAAGELQMDESIVEEKVRATLRNPHETEQILARMMRLRDPSGVYAAGGCIDTTREYPRWVCPGSSDIVLPER